MFFRVLSTVVKYTDVVSWTLQGQELRELRAARPFQRVVFCGDGANDLCPALALGPDDTVLARKVRLGNS